MIISEGLVSKTMKVLETLLDNEESLPLRALANRCGLPKSSLHRILVSLQKEGWVFQDPESREYRLGMRFLIFAGNWRIHQELVVIASPHMEELSELTGETVVLGVCENRELRVLHVVETPNPIKYHFRIGGILPLTAGAMGKIIMAYSGVQMREKVLSRPLPGYTHETIIDKQTFANELKNVKEKGFSVSLEEVDIGGAAIGAPVLDENNRLVAGIILDGLAPRIEGRLDELIPYVLQTADAISAELIPLEKKLGKVQSKTT